MNNMQQPLATHFKAQPQLQNKECKQADESEKQIQLFSQLYTLDKINTIDHNTNGNENNNSQSYQPSLFTKYILNRLQQNDKQMWKLLDNVPQLILQIIQYFNSNNLQNVYLNLQSLPSNQTHFIQQGAVQYKNKSTIYIGEGTKIEHGSVIVGPCLIGRNCEIRKGAYLRKNVIVADGSLVGNSSQLKNCILMDRCQIAHFNYVGDSILGIHAHFGASSVTSNFKLDGSLIKVNPYVPNDNTEIPQKQRKAKAVLTNRTKLGAIIGHNVQIGCQAVLNPGSIIGRNSIIYPLTNWRGFLSANRICKLQQQQSYVVKRQNK